MGSPRAVYMIVTNDEFEYPIIHDIVGNKACADFFGVKPHTLFRLIQKGKWRGKKYKAIHIGYEDEFDDLEPFVDKDNKHIAADEYKLKRIQERKEKTRERCRNRYRNNEKARNLQKERSKKYYQNHRQERLDYAYEYRTKKKMETINKVIGKE